MNEEISMEEQEQILSGTSFWNHLSLEEKKKILHHASQMQFGKDQLISSSDSSCMGIVFILRGGIRASLVSEEGREITLFRLQRGDCCVTTASCVIRQVTFDTVVTASEETNLLVIPASLVTSLLNDNIYFRAFVYEIETLRFSQTIWVMQELLFKRFDQRLAAYLLKEMEASGKTELDLTQEEIARNVNSAREVVARMLRHFSSEGLVEVKRGRIFIKDPKGLKSLI